MSLLLREQLSVIKIVDIAWCLAYLYNVMGRLSTSVSMVLAARHSILGLLSARSLDEFVEEEVFNSDPVTFVGHFDLSISIEFLPGTSDDPFLLEVKSSQTKEDSNEHRLL